MRDVGLETLFLYSRGSVTADASGIGSAVSSNTREGSPFFRLLFQLYAMGTQRIDVAKGAEMNSGRGSYALSLACARIPQADVIEIINMQPMQPILNPI